MSKTKKLSKVLALVIMLALVIGILPMGAMASTSPVYVRFFNGATQIGSTVSVTASDDTVYTAITAAISSNSSITSSDVTAYGINSINGITPSETTSEDDAWMYAVDDKLSDTAIGQMAVSSGSVITVFYAANYSTTLFSYIVPDGAATSGNAIAANSGDTVKYRVATSTVDFNNLYSTIQSGYSESIGSSQTTLEKTITVSGYTVIPAYKRVVASSTSILSSWRTATTAAYNALSSTQQGTINSTIVSNGTSSSATMTQVNALAYEVAPLTRNNSKALKRLSFSDSEGYMDIVQTSTGKNGFDPSVTAYTLETAISSITVNAEALASGATVSYSSSGTGMSVTSAGVITFSATGTYTLTVTVTNSGTQSYTVTIPYAAAASAGSVPTDACGYLPVGQFARGSGWGALYTSGSNASGGTDKFITGYVSTGVSLGMLGGYVQFDMGANSYISDDPTNPYGIDFIVYGNPFSGNPEAGSVMVSEDGKVWYNLAGSLHYNSDTTWNVDISYLKIATANTTVTGSNSNTKTFSTAGIYYSTDYVPTNSSVAATVNDAIIAANWTQLLTSTAWWPEYEDENYQNVWNDGHVGDTTDSNTTGDVYWNRTNTAAEVITYRGVTQVLDDAQKSLSGANATNYYRFGYADVRQAGSNYGTAVNPYDTLPAAAAGGDGFDLAWAVDRDGKPVDMSSKHIRFVRVYSSVFYIAGIFGETSAEVCGLYVASGSNTGNTTTAKATVKLGSTTISNGGTELSDTQRYITQSVTAGTNYTVSIYTGSSNYLFLNGEQISGATSSNPHTFNINLSAGESVTYQVLTQTGSRQPYVEVVTFTGVAANG